MSAGVPESKLTVTLRTLTPLWTGDMDRDSGRAKESGLLGSLRFWYEGMVREQGGRACDPVGGGCKKVETCEVCQLFGSTAVARRFRMEVQGLRAVKVFFRLSAEVGTTSGWWLRKIFGESRNALWGPDFRLVFYARGEKPERVMSELTLLLTTVAEQGGLGAKTQMGFGQVEVVAVEGMTPQGTWGREDLLSQARSRRGSSAGVSAGEEFTIHRKRFFSRVYELTAHPYGKAVDVGERPEAKDYDQSYIPCSFDIRYKHSPTDGLRPRLEAKVKGAQRVLGVGGEDARGSRLHVSHLYGRRQDEEGRTVYSLKFWGDVDSEQRDPVLGVIDEYVRSRFEVKTWRDMTSLPW